LALAVLARERGDEGGNIMSSNHTDDGISRRNFLKNVAASAGGLALAGGIGGAFAASPATTEAAPAPADPAWSTQIGLELFTVRDMVAKDYVGTLEKVAEIGYKEVEPAEGYNNWTPQQFRAELDRLGLKMPSTHSGISAGPTSEVEKQLDGFQIMGIQYTSLGEPLPAGGRGGRGRGAAPNFASMTPAEQRKMMAQMISRMAQPRTVEDVKQEAARYNKYGKIAQKFGIKLLRHNHTIEFIPCSDDPVKVPYQILLAETDPDLVVFQMDIGWAVVAGQNPTEWFNQHPGRFVLWHVKDAACLKCLPPVSQEGERLAQAHLVPVGNGEIDYKQIFTRAGLAGMKHFAIEQDSAADWGDSIAAARVSYQHLRSMLTASA
jgi:sugar phosphate isomerase/epimerase